MKDDISKARRSIGCIQKIIRTIAAEKEKLENEKENLLVFIETVDNSIEGIEVVLARLDDLIESIDIEV